MKKQNKHSGRREFLKEGILSVTGVAAGTGLISALSGCQNSGKSKKVKLLSTDGEIVEVDELYLWTPTCSHQ